MRGLGPKRLILEVSWRIGKGGGSRGAQPGPGERAGECWEAWGPSGPSLCFISYSPMCVVISEGQCSQDTLAGPLGMSNAAKSQSLALVTFPKCQFSLLFPSCQEPPGRHRPPRPSSLTAR